MILKKKNTHTLQLQSAASYVYFTCEKKNVADRTGNCKWGRFVGHVKSDEFHMHE